MVNKKEDNVLKKVDNMLKKRDRLKPIIKKNPKVCYDIPINPTEIYNNWIIFSKDRYTLVNTYDIEIDKPKDITKLKNFQTLNEFIKHNKMGESVLKEIKKQKLDKEYDAFNIIHVGKYGKDKLSIGVDCFKRVK